MLDGLGRLSAKALSSAAEFDSSWLLLSRRLQLSCLQGRLDGGTEFRPLLINGHLITVNIS